MEKANDSMESQFLKGPVDGWLTEEIRIFLDEFYDTTDLSDRGLTGYQRITETDWDQICNSISMGSDIEETDRTDPNPSDLTRSMSRSLSASAVSGMIRCRKDAIDTEEASFKDSARWSRKRKVGSLKAVTEEEEQEEKGDGNKEDVWDPLTGSRDLESADMSKADVESPYKSKEWRDCEGAGSSEFQDALLEWRRREGDWRAEVAERKARAKASG